MAYFDSPKNRAKWNKELDELRSLKKAREEGLSDEAVRKAVARDTGTAVRERVTYQELLAEERAGKSYNFQSAKTAPALSRKKERSQSGPER